MFDGPNGNEKHRSGGKNYFIVEPYEVRIVEYVTSIVLYYCCDLLSNSFSV